MKSFDTRFLIRLAALFSALAALFSCDGGMNDTPGTADPSGPGPLRIVRSSGASRWIPAMSAACFRTCCGIRGATIRGSTNTKDIWMRTTGRIPGSGEPTRMDTTNPTSRDNMSIEPAFRSGFSGESTIFVLWKRTM